MLCIGQALRKADELTALSDSARLDIELLLCAALQCERSYLYTWPEKPLSERQEAQFLQLFQRRLAGEPIAYIVGVREFWSLPLKVNNTTLIPRPATETLVAWALEHTSGAEQHVLDLGTGTGAIALALAFERHLWKIVGVDFSKEAVALAKKNALDLAISNCTFVCSDWFKELGEQRFNLIVSNPPYIAPTDPHLRQGDVRFEPQSALVAQGNGLDDIEHIAMAAPRHLTPGGKICIEHGFEQTQAVVAILKKAGFDNVGSQCDLEGNPRISFAQWQG